VLVSRRSKVFNKIPTTRLAGGLLTAYKADGAGGAHWRIERFANRIEFSGCC